MWLLLFQLVKKKNLSVGFWKSIKWREEEILKEGLAEVKYIYGDYFYTNRLKDAEKAAKRKKKNLWSDNKEEKINKKEEKSFFEKIIDFFIELLGF